MTAVDTPASRGARPEQPTGDDEPRAGHVPARAAGPPRRAGLIGALSVLLALAVAGLGGALLREALVIGGVVEGSAWLSQASDALDGLAPSATIFVAGMVAFLVGLVLVWIAVRRRSRTARRLAAATGAYLDRRSLVPLAEAHASRVAGVVSAHARIARGRLRLDVLAATEAAHDVENAVAEVVRTQLDALDHPMRVQCSARQALPGIRRSRQTGDSA